MYDPESKHARIECSVCCEAYNKSTHKPIPCQAGCDFYACSSCYRRYLVDSVPVLRCMSCNKEWNESHVAEHFPNNWRRNILNDARKLHMLESAKSMMPYTQKYVPIYKVAKSYEEEAKNLFEKAMYFERMSRWTKSKAVEARSLAVLANEKLKDSNTVSTKPKQVLIKCPSPQCRGVIYQDEDTCEVCDSTVCSKCHLIITDVNTHVCDEKTVATVRLLSADSKPCPTCATPIHKIDGCDQMWCPVCKVAFSWKSGAIETGFVHNPHYYEYVRMSGGVLPRNPFDVPCNNDVFNVGFHQYNLHFYTTRNHETPEWLSKLHQQQLYVRIEWIQGAFKAPNVQVKEHKDRIMRIKYLIKDIDEDDLASYLIRCDRKERRDKEHRDVLNTFVMASASILLKSLDYNEDLDHLHNETKTLVTYINECLHTLHNIHSCTKRVITIY